MQNVNITRTPEHPYLAATIEPEDGSWVLQVDKAGAPHLLIRTNVEADDGTKSHGWIDVRDCLREWTVEDIQRSSFGGEVPDEEIDPADFPGVRFPADHPFKRAG